MPIPQKVKDEMARGVNVPLAHDMASAMLDAARPVMMGKMDLNIATVLHASALFAASNARARLAMTATAPTTKEEDDMAILLCRDLLQSSFEIAMQVSREETTN